jgi:serine O-acetyltransferase
MIKPRYKINKQGAVKLINKLHSLLFPGYFENCKLKDTELLLDKKLKLLGCKKEIGSIFLKQIPKIKEVLLTDLDAAFDGDPAAQDKDEIIIAYPGIYAIAIYRLAHELYKLSVPLLPRIMTEHAHSITGIDIHPGAQIGKYFFIDHGTGIVIGETTIIGEHVKIYQGVTLGALSLRGGQALKNKKRHPTVEDNVTIYSNASIFGGETVIGTGSVLGSGVFVTCSVASNSRLQIPRYSRSKC